MMGGRTRLGLWGHNTRRTGSFAGKALFVAPTSEPGFVDLADAVLTSIGLRNWPVTIARLADGAVTGTTMRNEKP